MALRKLRKTMKPVIWAVTIAFVISIFFIGAGSVAQNNPKVALKVNGKKVETMKIERTVENNVENYRNYFKGKAIDYDAVKLMTIHSIIEAQLLINEAGKVGVGISGKDVEAKFKEVTSGITSTEQLKRMLKYQGLTIGDLKKDIKDNLTAEKVKEKIKAKYIATEADINDYYAQNKEKYENKPLAEVKAKVAEDVKTANSSKYYNKWLEDAYAKAKIETKVAEYAKYIKATVLTAGKYPIDNIEFYNNAFYKKLYFGMPDDKSAFTAVIDGIQEDVALANEAEARGLKVKGIKMVENGKEEIKDPAKQDKIDELKRLLQEDVRSKITYVDADLKGYFDKNKTKYETKENVSIKPVMFKVEATEADKKAAKAKAEAILKDALAGKDFAALAKANSQDIGSGANGGELGWFGKGQMVKEFETAAFATTIGAIHPSIVKTQFGYHIIKVEDVNEAAGQVKASHILIKEDPSAETKAAVKAKADALLAEITAKKTDIDKAMAKSEADKKEEIKDIQKGGYIPGLGSDQKLGEELFKMKEGETKVIEGTNGVYLVNLTKYNPFKAPALEEVKDKVIKDFTTTKAIEEITKITTEKKNSVKIDIKDEKIKSILK